MSGQLVVFAGSLAGVAVLILFAWLLGLGRGARIADENEARELADNALVGFEAVEIALDAQGCGALLADADGRIMLLTPHGANFTARLIEAARTSREGGRLTIDGIPLDLGDSAGAWENRLMRLNS